MLPSEVKFLRQKDYTLVRELGRGACGVTVLLNDPSIDHQLVCKKFAPSSVPDSWRMELFVNFVSEIKVLHLLAHPNIVRIFNFYIYPEKQIGYLTMEYIEGEAIDAYVVMRPDQAVSIFNQLVSGFSYLEEQRILHRDIRTQNIMVDASGVVKIIDFGFGKMVSPSGDFDKSISLNW
ncbi:MAG: protein kinase, partial [Verrucomicrobiota bacterium]